MNRNDNKVTSTVMAIRPRVVLAGVKSCHLSRICVHQVYRSIASAF
jgi:hypothetical protein